MYAQEVYYDDAVYTKVQYDYQELVTRLELPRDFAALLKKCMTKCRPKNYLVETACAHLIMLLRKHGFHRNYGDVISCSGGNPKIVNLKIRKMSCSLCALKFDDPDSPNESTFGYYVENKPDIQPTGTSLTSQADLERTVYSVTNFGKPELLKLRKVCVFLDKFPELCMLSPTSRNNAIIVLYFTTHTQKSISAACDHFNFSISTIRRVISRLKKIKIFDAVILFLK